MKIEYYGPFAQPTGYARAMHDYCTALARANVELEIQPLLDCDPDKHLEPLYRPLIELATRKSSNPVTHRIVHTVPMHAHEFISREPGVKNICYTTWETDSMPCEMFDGLNEFDLILVPSAFCKAVMGGNGRTDLNIKVLPHAFCKDFWFRHREPSHPEETYVFYTIGIWSDRKNLEGTIKAYLSAFGADDNVLLRILTPQANHDRIEELRAASGFAESALPPIEVVAGHYDHEMLYQFHAKSNCFVSTARGEGWGLGAFEAALVGNAVIAPTFGGMVDFLEYSSVWTGFVSGMLTPCFPAHQAATQSIRVGEQTLNIKAVKSSAPSGIRADQVWYEPNLAETANHMTVARDARAGYDQALHDMVTRSEMEALYGYETIAKQLLATLEAL